MAKDLTTSNVSRQNILNNHVALVQVESHLDLGGIHWHDEAIMKSFLVMDIKF